MKKPVLLLLAASVLSGCADSMWVDGKKYGTYGLLNEKSMRSDKVEYRLVAGNVIWSVILCETIFMPLYFIGFSIYEPVGPAGRTEKGVVQ